MNQKFYVKNQSRIVPSIAEQLRQLSRIYVTMQQFRNRSGNLLRSKLEYLDDVDKKYETLFAEHQKESRGKEQEIKKEMEVLVKSHPWGEYLLNIKGVGPGIAASIIGELCGAVYSSIDKGEVKDGDKLPKPELIGYGRRFESTSDLWAYAGYGVADGKAQRRQRGVAYSHNKYLKLTGYKFICNQIKQGDHYRELYDQRKAYEKEMHPELTKMHIENRTRRYVIKKFLSDVKHDLIDKEGTS